MIFDFIHETKNVKNIKYIDLNNKDAHDYLQSDKDYKKHYEKIKDDYDGEIAIDAKTNELVGYVFIKNKKSGEEGFISPLFVVKKYRGFGIGKTLLNHAINKYNAVDLVVDKDNTIAFNMYKKHGFVIIGDGNNKDQYWMKLKSKLSKEDKVITETKRSELPDSAFGIPEDRKYPLHDKEHVESAIRLFGHAEESKKKSLAKRIKIAADRYGIEIKPITQVYKYLNESYINESWVNDLDAIIEFNKKLNNMEYIIVTKNKKVITQIKAKDFDNYETLNPSEFIKYNGGICWDYVMYEAYAFSKYFRNIKYKTFFVCNYNKKSNPTHTFLLFYLNNKCYWFESSWKSHIGIYKFNSESCALSYITKTLYSDLSKDQLPVYEVFVREYNALDNNLINISGYEYMNYMDKLDDYKFNKTSICEPEYIYDAKKFFYHESYINENKKYEDIYDAIINGLRKYDQDPRVGKKDEELFKNTGKSRDDDFGNKLCICNLKGDYTKICQKVNKELKPLGARLSPDNYGTAFVHLNEQTQTERFYEVLKKKLEEDNNDEYINESFVRINIDRSELTEEMLIDAANKCAHYTKWCKMDDSSFCCVNELNSFSVNVNDATFCFATFNGDEELLSRVLKCCNDNNSSRYGKFEVFAKENEHGIWLCGRMTELYTYKEVNESYITEGENMFIENNLFNKQDIYYNKDKFDSGEINLCFITGHSGSGKSTMGRNMQSDNIEHYELDDLQCIKDHFTMSNLKEYGDLIYSYFNGQGKRFYITYKELVDNKIPGKEYEDILYKDFVHYAMKYANMHRDKKYVIEGVWLFCGDENKKPYFEPSEFKDYAFYIKGTSMIISKHRGALRDAKEDNNTKLGTAKSYVNNFFRKNWKWYFIDEKQINKFRKYFSNLQRSTNESYINETSMRSKFNDSFEKKGNIKLSSFNKVTMDKQFIDKYKDKFKLLKHVDLNDDKRIAFLDKDNNLVGYIITNKEKDGLIWITALEISNQYKGYGLGKQLLDYGVKHLGAQALGVAHDNEVAIKMYEKYGFKISKESIDEVKRKENLNYRMYIGSAVNEACINEACKNPREARKFIQDVQKIAKKYDANYYIVTDGASATNNNGNPAVKVARDAVAEWERNNGFDDREDWSKNPDDFSNYRLKESNINESLEVDLTTSQFEKEIKLYHGDSYQDQQSIIKPEAINAGTKLSTPRMSSFWTRSFKYAECFAIMRLIGKYLGYKEVCFDGDMYHMYVKPSNYKQIEKSIKSCHIFVYEKTMDKKMISGGHVFYGEEFTIDVPVKPDKVYRLEFNDFKDIFYDAVICYPDDSDTTINNICNKSFEQMIKNGYKFDNIIKILLYHNPKEQLRIVKKYKKLQKASSVLESNKSDQLEVPDSYNNKPSVLELLDNTDPKRIFLSSDWHFYSLKYKKEKNAVNTRDIVSWCKNNIKDEDVFMYLGDMCFRWASDEDNKKVQEIFKSLPGIKILILGNHDIVAGEDFYLNCGFDYILTELVWHDYIFTHKPININSMNYIVDFHGHQHRWSEYNTTDGSKNVNVYPYYYDNKPVTLDYLLNNYEELIKKHGNKRSNWVGMGEASYTFGDTRLYLDGINWWYVCLNNRPSCIDEELYYKTLEDAIKAYIKPEYFEKSDRITAYVYTCNGDRIDHDDNALKLIPMGKIWVDKDHNYDWTYTYPLDVIDGKIIPVTNNEYFIKESSCMIEDLLNNINEYSAASYNPMIPTAKPHLVQLSIDNSVFSGTKFAFSQDIVSNKYMIVNEDCKLEIVDASALADIKCKIYEFVGNKYNINKIEEAYKNDCTVDQAFLYTALSNKNLVTKDQIDFDDDFVPVDIELIKEKRESEKATIKEQWSCINGEQLITFPVLESAIIKNPLKGELVRYNDNIHLMESVDGYYLMNDLNNKRTKCVSSLDYITTAMIKSIY